MEIINIEKNVFDMVLLRINEFKSKIEQIGNVHSDKELSLWLDGQDVCLMLNISLRTLQSYRDSRRIGFSQVGHKIYYRPEDIRKFMDDAYISKAKDKG